jgi:hypothetical protein
MSQLADSFMAIFGFKRVESQVRLPQKGEVWFFNRYQEEGDPWPPRKRGSEVTILDVKAGWVRYSMMPAFPDNRMEIKFFVRLYAPLGGGNDS